MGPSRSGLPRILATALLLSASSPEARASEFRAFQAIPTGGVRTRAPEPRVAAPVDRQEIDQAVRKVFASWNDGGLDRYLGDGLFDRSRLVENVDGRVPRDARIRVMAIQGIQSVGQRSEPDPSAPGMLRVIDTVSVTARTQIQFNDPARGFQRIEGTNEYVFEITRRLAP